MLLHARCLVSLKMGIRLSRIWMVKDTVFLFNPYPFSTPVYRPAIEITEQSAINEAPMENLLYDAETLSTWFGQCSVSLSVIYPKQLRNLKTIYNAAKPNQRISEPAVDIKLPHFLVLISDGFSCYGNPGEIILAHIIVISNRNENSSKALKMLAANWPPTMDIVHLISQDYENNKQYSGEADFLVFRAMDQNGFLSQLQENKLQYPINLFLAFSAVIALPSQTLLLSVSDKA
ncbi:hypothetical protein KSS87_019724 [Heliosperma pusillum]|nr:hypothetical protein KSS87_019724 [Heliosperma pusillum]